MSKTCFGRTKLTAQAVGADLDIERGELLEVIQQPSSELDESTSHDEYPSSAPDIPLSKLGSLFLFVARVASVVLFGSPATLPSFDIMPNHDRVVRTFIGTAGNGGLENAGTESDPIVDGVLALGLWAYNNNRLGDLSETNDMEFTEYLQVSHRLPFALHSKLCREYPCCLLETRRRFYDTKLMSYALLCFMHTPQISSG